jgi:hypothetical protein
MPSPKPVPTDRAGLEAELDRLTARALKLIASPPTNGRGAALLRDTRSRIREIRQTLYNPQR